MAEALELLEKALNIDPDYPLALTLSTWCRAQHSVHNRAHNSAAMKARPLSKTERAAGLSGDEPLILSVLGVVHTFTRNYRTARILVKPAIYLDPNAAWATRYMGWLEVYADRPEAAFEHYERAMRLSPPDPMNVNNLIGMASAHQVAGDYEASANLFQRALLERPTAYWIHGNLAPALLAAERAEEAQASVDAWMALHLEFKVARLKEAMVSSAAAFQNI